MEKRIRDAILGLIVGDALGVPVESAPRSHLKQVPVRDMQGYGIHDLPPGTWSDDSSLTLCTMDALLQGYDLDRLGNRFMGWLYQAEWTPYGETFGVGQMTRSAICNLREGIPPHESGGTDEWNNGNGALMRILPLLFYLQDIESPVKQFKKIRAVSSITHGHIRSGLACYYYLEVAAELWKGRPPSQAYQKANTSFEDLAGTLKVGAEELATFDRLLEGSIAELPEEHIQSTGYVMHTLEASMWCILTTSGYQKTVLKAVNLGSDTDTTAAVTGGLAGIIYSADAIPGEWLGQLARKEDIEELIQEFEEVYV